MSNLVEGELLDSARVRWQCRRGMLELDLLLLCFFDKNYETLSADQKKAFVRLLQYPDQELNDYLLGKSQPVEVDCRSIVQQIRDRRWKA